MHNIPQQLIDTESGKDYHLVTILLDSEDAWEYYKNDGKDFLNSLYEQVGQWHRLIETVTPQRISRPGS